MLALVYAASVLCSNALPSWCICSVRSSSFTNESNFRNQHVFCPLCPNHINHEQNQPQHPPSHKRCCCVDCSILALADQAPLAVLQAEMKWVFDDPHGSSGRQAATMPDDGERLACTIVFCPPSIKDRLLYVFHNLRC